MSIYNNGKIYKLVNSFGTTYIGSTTQTLAQRKTKHAGYYKAYLKDNTNNRLSNSVKLFVEDLENVDIVLLELVNCNSKMELHQRERHYIETLECVNKYVPGRTMKEWRIDNDEKLKEYSLNYYIKNIDIIKAKQKVSGKKDRLLNAEKIKAEKAKQVLCECGLMIGNGHISRHRKSMRHLKLIENPQ